MRRSGFILAALLAVGLVPAGCNVFVTLDRCHTDGDCRTGYICDREGRFCLAVDAGVSPIEDAGSDVVTPPDADADAAPDVVLPPCDVTAPFAPPLLVPGLGELPINSARLSSDELTVTFSALKPGCDQEVCADIFYATRTSRDLPFDLGTRRALSAVNSEAAEYWPTLTADARLLFFESDRSLVKDGGVHVPERSRIWTATRQNTLTSFSEPYVQPAFRDVPAPEGNPYLHPDGTGLYLASYGRSGNHGGLDLYFAKLDPFGDTSAVTNLDALNTNDFESSPVVTRDDLQLFFAREPRDFAKRKIWVGTRTASSGQFGAPHKVDELNSDDEEFPAWISDDQCRFYLISNRPTSSDAGPKTFRFWVASRQR